MSTVQIRSAISQPIQCFKYHVSCADGKISLRIKIEITFIFRFHFRPIQLVVFIPVGLSLFLRHLRQILLGVKTSPVARPGQLTIQPIVLRLLGRSRSRRNPHLKFGSTGNQTRELMVSIERDIAVLQDRMLSCRSHLTTCLQVFQFRK